MTQTNNEREAFEKWYQSQFTGKVDFKRYSANSIYYDNDDIDTSWEAWEARSQSPISQNEQKEHCCPECGCHFVGEFPFEYKTKQAIPDGWVAVPVELLKDITNCFDNVPSRAHVVNGTDENLKRIAQWVNSSDGGYGLYHAVNHYLQSAPKLNEKG